MTRILARAGGIFAALLMAAVVGTVAASPAQAAGCSGASCVHQEPNAQGCSGTTPVGASVTPPGGGPVILLRWASNCVANWARFADSNDGIYSPGGWTYWVETNDGHREDKLFPNAKWTYMVNGNLLARACIKGYATSSYNCTSWY